MAHETTLVVRGGLERFCKDFSLRMTDLGFKRTRKMFWSRANPLTIEFVHLFRHGSSYGAPINHSVRLRVHFGIRVLNDDFVAAALNGPHSDAEAVRVGRYHLSFNAQTGSTYERCLDDLVRFVRDRGEPWFDKYRSADVLVSDPESPLNASAKSLLAAAASGHVTEANVTLSKKILGVS